MLVLFPLVVVIYVVSNALINHKPSSKLYIICNTMYMYLSCPWFVRKKPVVVADGNSACPRLEDSVSYLWESNHLNNQHLILRSWHVCLWWRPPCGSILIKFLCFPIESPMWQVLLLQSHTISMNPPWNHHFFVNSPVATVNLSLAEYSELGMVWRHLTTKSSGPPFMYIYIHNIYNIIQYIYNIYI